MVNCLKYTRYLHKSELMPLHWYEKILMRYHYLICKWCRKYTKENEEINNYIKSHLEHQLSVNEKEIEQQKQELLKKLNL